MRLESDLITESRKKYHDHKIAAAKEIKKQVEEAFQMGLKELEQQRADKLLSIDQYRLKLNWWYYKREKEMYLRYRAKDLIYPSPIFNQIPKFLHRRLRPNEFPVPVLHFVVKPDPDKFKEFSQRLLAGDRDLYIPGSFHLRGGELVPDKVPSGHPTCPFCGKDMPSPIYSIYVEMRDCLFPQYLDDHNVPIYDVDIWKETSRVKRDEIETCPHCHKSFHEDERFCPGVMVKHCKYDNCGAEFNTFNDHRKYCCPYCKSKAQQNKYIEGRRQKRSRSIIPKSYYKPRGPYQKQCAICGKLFEARTNMAQTCGPAHRKALSRRNKN